MPTQDLLNFEPSAFQPAIQQFWDARSSAASRQRTGAAADRGNRQAVTSGGHLDGFLDVIVETITSRGLARSEDIRRGRTVSVVPGYFRPQKEWDLVVLKGEQLGAVIELKAQVGPSFGNNFNNRAEEALGNADDFWVAYREGAFGDQPAPWVGYLFVLEDHVKAKTPVRVQEPIFGVFPEFVSTSYEQRYEMLLRRMVRERRYSAASLLVSPKTGNVPAVWSEPADDLGTKTWMRSLMAHLAGL